MMEEEAKASIESNGTCQNEAQQLPIAEGAPNQSLIQKEDNSKELDVTLEGRGRDSEEQVRRSQEKSGRKSESNRDKSRSQTQDRKEKKRSSRSSSDRRKDSRKRDSLREYSPQKPKDSSRRENKKDTNRRSRSESSRRRKDRKNNERSSHRSKSRSSSSSNRRRGDSKSKSKKSSHQSQKPYDRVRERERDRKTRRSSRGRYSDESEDEDRRSRKHASSSLRNKDRSRRSRSRSDRKKESSRSQRHSQKDKDKKKRHQHSSSRSNSNSSSSAERSRKHRKSHRDSKRKDRTSRSRSPKKRLSEAEMRRLDREKRYNNGRALESQLKKPVQAPEGGKFIIDCNNVRIDIENNFWDGFCWQPRIKRSGQLDQAVLKQTEKQRKIQVLNVPLHLGLDKIDIISYVTNFMKENFLANEGNDTPVLDCEINEGDNSANIELSSVEETNLMCKVISFKMFQNDCRIYRLGDAVQGQPSMLALTQQAIRQAEAQAAVIKATESLLSQLSAPSTDIYTQEQEEKEVNPYSSIEVYSTVIKVANTIELGTENTLTEDDWEDLHADLIEEFERYGKIQYHFIIRPFQATVGAKSGTLFIEYETKQAAQHAIGVNNDRKFNSQVLKIYSLPLDSFDKNFRPLISIRK